MNATNLLNNIFFKPSVRQMICQRSHVVVIKMWVVNGRQNIHCCIADAFKIPLNLWRSVAEDYPFQLKATFQE